MAENGNEMESHFQYCADLLRKQDYQRYIACLYLDNDLRQAAFAIHAFNCKICQIPSLVSEPMPGELRIGWWRDEIANTNIVSGDPVARALQEVITRYALPVSVLDRLLDARIFDLYHDPVADKSELETYLAQTRSSLFHLLTMVSARPDEISDNSLGTNDAGIACDHAGIFTGIVELLGDLPRYDHQNQSFFPDDLSAHRRLLPEIEPGNSKHINDQWLKDIIAYALQHHDAAMAAISRLPVQSRMLFLGLALPRYELERIAKHGINLASPGKVPSKLRINWCLWKASRALAQGQ